MNIVYHHRTRGAGAEGVHIMGIVKALRTLGHQVSILSLPGSDPESNVVQPQKASAEEANAKPLSLPQRIILSLIEMTKKLPEWCFELLEVFYSLLSVFRVFAALTRNDADFLYERYSLFLFGGVLAAKMKGVPVILEVNDSAIVERVRPLALKGLARVIEAWIFRRCDGIVFISSTFQSKAQQAHGKIAPSVICPNGADLEQFTLDDGERETAKANLGLSGHVVCGYVGAFVYWHGIDWFVDEILPHLSRHPKLTLLLVGDGVVFESISKAVESQGLADQVILTGRVPHAMVRQYVAAMDYGILPDSNDYGSPMKLFEMMAMKVPLVSPAFSPIEEVVEDGVTGWLFPPKDKKAAVNKVLELASQQQEVERVSVSARSYIENSRQWKHNAESLLKLVERN